MKTILTLPRTSCINLRSHLGLGAQDAVTVFANLPKSAEATTLHCCSAAPIVGCARMGLPAEIIICVRAGFVARILRVSASFLKKISNLVRRMRAVKVGYAIFFSAFRLSQMATYAKTTMLAKAGSATLPVRHAKRVARGACLAVHVAVEDVIQDFAKPKVVKAAVPTVEVTGNVVALILMLAVVS